jgi:hypothetical protein
MCPDDVLKNTSKLQAFTAASVHSSAPSRVSQGKTSTKIIKSRAMNGTENSTWRAPSSSSFIRKKKLKAKHRKNNFKKMVHNLNASNSDKNDDTDCCK